MNAGGKVLAVEDGQQQVVGQSEGQPAPGKPRVGLQRSRESGAVASLPLFIRELRHYAGALPAEIQPSERS